MKNFIINRPRLSGITVVLVCLGVGFAVTQVEANISNTSKVALDNPHYIPDEFNPKFKKIEDHLSQQKLEVKEALSERPDQINQESDTMHSIAFKDRQLNTKPVYDYTTGQSN
jgi:hypothetical protein